MTNKIAHGLTLECIETLDQGNGADTQQIYKKLGLPNKVIKTSLEKLKRKGEVYEPSEGVLKTVN